MYLPKVKATDLKVTDEVVELLQQRVFKLRELDEIDNKLESIRNNQVEIGLIKGPLSAPPEVVHYKSPVKREYPCHCGAVLPSYLERDSHIKASNNPTCGRDGEILNGRHVHRDDTIVGDPIKTSTPIRKSTAKFIDDDLEIA